VWIKGTARTIVVGCPAALDFLVEVSMSEIGNWLEGLGLRQLASTFADAAIDLDVLPEITEEDLEKLGIPLGHRKRLMRAIAALGKAALPSAEPQALGIGGEATPAAVSVTRPEAERRQLSVMFVDLVGSTALSHKLDPEDMREVIRAYQNTVAGEITRFEGHVAKYMGDGVLAYFGYPKAHEDEAERAVRVGLALVDAVCRLSTPVGESLAARVGIATGLVVVGDLIGEGVSQEQAVVGDTANLAARLQGVAQSGQVVIAEATRRLIGAGFNIEHVGSQTLKGFVDPIEAFAVLGERVVESRFELRSGPSVLPMVGRDQELALLLERWAQAKTGEGQGVLLVGEAGIGKSRISRALLDALADEPHTRIHYQCSPYHTDSALRPVIQQLGHAAGFAGEDALETRLDKLEALLDQSGGRDAAPLIADLLGLDGAARYGALNLAPQTQRVRTLAALVDQLLGLAARQSVLVVLEDAHWIDPTTLEMIGQALDRIAEARVLILLTSRPDQQPELAGHPHVTRLTLNRLSRGGVKAIVARLGGDLLPPETIDAIIARTDGVPLFVEELTKALLETGDTAIPASLHDSLMARLDRIPDVKEIAQIAACIGRDFAYPLLEAVAGKAEPELRASLDKLAAAEIVFRRGTPPDARFTFKHALVQDAAYQSLLRSRRQQLHACIAQTLEQHFSETVEAEPELLARHYSDARLAEQAIGYWRKAGERALRRSANREAIEHLTKGLELLGTLPDTVQRARRELPFQITLGPALMAVRGQAAPEVGRSYARALELGPKSGDTLQHFQALWGSWRYHFVSSDHQTARGLGERCVGLAEDARDDAVMLEACFALGGSLMLMGDFATARGHIERAIALYDIDRHSALRFEYGQDPGASCLVYLGWTLWYLGMPERAIESARKGLALAEALDHPFTRAQVLMYLALTHAFCRDWCAARSYAETSIELSKEHGFPQTLWLCSSIRAGALIADGCLETGIPKLEESTAARKAIGVAAARMYELALLAEAYGTAGRIDEGLQALAEAVEFANRTAEGFHLPEVHRINGELRLRRGASEEAAVCFGQALDVARRQQARSLELRAATNLARLWADLGERQKARDLLAPIYDWYTEGFDTADLKDAKALLDELG
jgi:class 3 adenylate cyclase/tetratricopeptide (TPR) repeat protein/ABC-type transport system involved in cytochrome c biogenesis ATPase subunit